MSVTLGKRKRRAGGDIEKDQNDHADDGDLRARFQRAFEAKFKPLAKTVKPVVAAPDPEAHLENEDSEQDAWSGLSDDGDKIVEVINHDPTNNIDFETQRREMKEYMSSKPPTSGHRTTPTAEQKVKADEDDSVEANNIKHDLALQRLLKESHLLDSSSVKSASTAPEGKGRIKALDLRLKDLGAKKAIGEQEKMPIAHRKGINAKVANREAGRRKEAAENGIILEKAKMTTKAEPRRDRGIGAPSIGKFRGGTLKLTSRDVRSVEGSRRGGGAGRGRGRGRGR